MALPSVIQSIVSFLRAGYPEGVPEHDYIPLFALLRRRLTEEEVVMVAAELIAWSTDPVDAAPAIRQAIEAQIKAPALDSDVERVRAHLTDVGLDLDGPIQP